MLLYTHNWRSLAVCILVLLPACGMRDTRYFPYVNRNQAVMYEKNTIEVSVHQLSEHDCNEYFGVDLMQEGYAPLLLSITNNGPERYTFRPSYLDLERTSGRGVAQLMHYDTYLRVMLLTVPAVFFWWPALPFLIVPYGFSCALYNEKKTKEIRAKALKYDESLIIGPYERVKKFIFVQDYALRRLFDISLFNEDTKQLVTFNIDLADSAV